MIKKLRSFLFKSQTSINAFWLVGGKVIQMILGLFISILTARYLGPSNYGLINYASAYIGFFSALCTLGINSVIVKEFIDKKEKDGVILGTSMILKFISSFLSIIAIMVVVFVLDFGETETIIVVGISSLSVLFNIMETLNYWFQSKLQSKYTAIATFVGFACTAIYRIVLLIHQSNIYMFALINSIDYLLVGILLLIFYKKNKGTKFGFSISYAKSLLSKSWHFILPGLMVSIYAQTDKIMLKQMISETEIGFYSTALAICNMWCFILTAIIDSFYPSIMELFNLNKYELYERRNKQLYAIVFYMSVGVSAILCVLAPAIVFILYGNDYANAVSPLRIITWYTAFSYLGVARNAWIVCENKQKYLIWTYIASAFINVGLNFALIPILGASGAALASLCAQALTTMIVPLFIKPLKGNTILMFEAILFRGIK